MSARHHHLSVDDACDLFLENDRLRAENDRLLDVVQRQAERLRLIEGDDPATTLDEPSRSEGAF